MERQTSQLWKTRGVLGEPDTVVSGNPYWLLPTVLGLSEDGSREVDAQRLKEYKAGIAGGYQVDDPAGLPEIVGLKEIPGSSARSTWTSTSGGSARASPLRTP